MIQHPMWKEFDQFRREIENVIQGLGAWPLKGAPFAPWDKAAYAPDIRVYQDEDAVKVEADIPGVEPDSLPLSIEDDTLIISGDKPGWAGSAKTAANGNGHSEGAESQAQPETTFKRSIALPVKVDADLATAECAHGVLRVTLPKAAAAKARKIEVAVG